ncbi:hydrogenase expression/formation protein HypE [Motiliproteus sp. MSK22-1]|uniref:hydrogenase expression/formation protein HypE n=1 Tax=Motiliproteus sp. MSK22-1 TaxID=1897630 RepID=UPI0009773624|nr:hydrogenase expression/formation protein HypE [Motiliproteus sp. MSK22-1]OMH32126.1 hydrogenase expression/formation protein HypE [Motiliproteus sp. MSK22-1]
MSANKRKYTQSLDLVQGKVEMAHGAGGKAMAQLIEQLFIRAFDNPALNVQSDQAMLALPDTAGLASGKIVMATDSHVISPLFFPGGDIGSLSVHGTVNDVVMSGAKALYLSVGFILEEGFPLADLKRIVDSMAFAAREAGVAIVTGDTKVVEKGNGDGVFINTTGIGVLPEGLELSTDQVRVGDKVLVSGSLGDHGVAIMSLRENLTFETTIESDSQSLDQLVARMIDRIPDIRCMRDPTRGGLAATLNEIAGQADVGIQLQEEAIPVKPQVRAACEFLGLDPLYVANEGKLIVICPKQRADELLALMHDHPQGADAAIIGEVFEDPNHFVQLKTSFGGMRMVDWISGEQLPRIC